MGGLTVRRRIAVTGVGTISPLADSPGDLHAALCAGRSGLKSIELFPTDGLGDHRAGEIRPFEPRDHLGERNLRPVDRTSRLLLVAAQQALDRGVPLPLAPGELCSRCRSLFSMRSSIRSVSLSRSCEQMCATLLN